LCPTPKADGGADTLEDVEPLPHRNHTQQHGDNAPDPAEALTAYCELMEDWAHAVQENSPLSEMYPVAAVPTPEHAEMLLTRTRFIRERLIPLAKVPPETMTDAH